MPSLVDRQATRGRACLGWALVCVVGTACKRAELGEPDAPSIELGRAHLRTDMIGGGTTAKRATFVLIDAHNRSSAGVWASLSGDLVDARDVPIGHLAASMLWIPPGGARTFALIDDQLAERPNAASARVVKHSSQLAPPLTTIEDVHTFDDHGTPITQGYLVNEASEDATIVVAAPFRDSAGTPVARPHYIVKVMAKPATGHVIGNCPELGSPEIALASKCALQMVGPRGTSGDQLFVADAEYGNDPKRSQAAK